MISKCGSLILVGTLGLSGCQWIKDKTGGLGAAKKPATETEKVSYIIGFNFGRNLKFQNVEVDAAQLLAGIQAATSGKEPALTEQEQGEVMRTFQSSHMEKQNKKREEDTAKNKKEGEDFLAANKTKEGVVTTESGLQYKIITAGNGPKPGAEDTVKTHYRGTLIDGTEFDSSIARNEPAEFPVNRVIKGWTEALQLMPVGSKWQLWIPSELAYGEQGSGPKIGPNSTLIFEVELLEIKKAEAPAKEEKKAPAKKK
jgi:FKBP-type peptidyl-prolyl cis-trans isomerase FklB